MRKMDNDEEIEKEIIDYIKKNNAESASKRIDAVHLYDLLPGCLRKSWFSKKMHVEDSEQNVLWYLRGHGVHDFIENLYAKYKGAKTEQRQEYDIDGNKILFTPDIMTNEAIIDIKTAAKLRKEECYPHHKTQVMWYCALTGRKTGILIYFTFLKYSEELKRYISEEHLRAYKFNFLEQELEMARNEMKERFYKFKGYLDRNEMPPKELKPNEEWACSYCQYKTTCNGVAPQSEAAPSDKKQSNIDNF